ncbi:hypothetical protein [Labrys miyagiensis]
MRFLLGTYIFQVDRPKAEAPKSSVARRFILEGAGHEDYPAFSDFIAIA